MLAATLAFFAVGCRRSDSGNLPTTTVSPKGTIHIERVNEAEMVLAELGRKAWVFKHRGGELTTDFTVFHRPEGKDQTQRVIFRRFGDDAVRMLHALAEDDRQNDGGGYVIVAIPEFRDGRGEVTHSFSLNGASCYGTASANEIYPESVISHSGSSSGGGGTFDKPVKLSPGESKTLVDYSVRLDSGGTDVPLLEREMVRYVVTVTTLQDGQLPKREEPATKE